MPNDNNIMKLMSYQAGIAIACSTVIGLMFTSGMSFGSDQKTLKDTEERSKTNEQKINIILLQNEKTSVTLENIQKQLEELAKKKNENGN